MTTLKDIEQAPPPFTEISTKIESSGNDAQNKNEIKGRDCTFSTCLPHDKFDNTMKLLNLREGKKCAQIALHIVQGLT